MSVPVLCIQSKPEELQRFTVADMVKHQHLFRNEDSGEMHGLTRVRQFTISEGHLIVRPDQMVEEFKNCIALAQYCLTDFRVRRRCNISSFKMGS